MSSNNCNCEELDQLRRDLAIECKEKLKAQAEVERLRNNSPEYGKPIKALIRHYKSGAWETVELVAEEDCYKFNDGCKLVYEWTVVYWEYKAERQEGEG
jgi:hypothetical protein